MSYESRAYDNRTEFGDEPVVVVVIAGTHDVSRFVNLLAGGQPVIEQLQLGQRVREQVRRHSGGRAALALLRSHGGPDFTDDDADDSQQSAAAQDAGRASAGEQDDQ